MQEQYLEKGLEIIKTLNSFTYQAYLVGGVVRDYIMDNKFVDIDIATNATPTQIQAIYPDVNMEYEHLGCVTLKLDGFTFEISTFKEEEYTEPRKPSKIYYAQELIDDVKRRDFTINALALTDNLKVVDLVKGQKDIKKKKVRVIGKAKVRFKEDPLRILRAYNLVARFNFNISFFTALGIKKTNKYLKTISNHQISREILKIFEAPFGRKAIGEMIDNRTFKYLKHYKDGMACIYKYYKKLSTIEKLTLCFALSEEIPENTSFDKNMLNKIQTLYKVVEETKHYTKNSKENINEKDVFDYGLELLLSALKINYYIRDDYPKLFNKVKKMDKNLPIHEVGELKLNGKDVVLLNRGVAGPYVKTVMDQLVTEVLLGKVNNDYNELKVRTLEILDEMNGVNIQEEKPKEETVVKQDVFPVQEVVYPKQEEVAQTKVVDIYEDEKPKVEVSNEIIRLKVHYDLEFNELVKNALASFIKGNESDDEVDALKTLIAKQVKEALLSQNPEYHILEQKGLI